MLFGPLYEKNMKNMEKNGSSTLPEVFEKLSDLTEILYFQEIWPFFEKKAIHFFILCQF